MAEEIRDLIEKINQEGIKVAEEKAQQIEGAAKEKADEMLARAKLEAEKIIASAKEKIARDEEREKTLLLQAGRDLLLVLRKEINTMLERIVVSEIRQALTPDYLVKILSELIKNCASGQNKDIVISLKKEDLEAMEKSLLNKLKEETKKGVILRPSEEILGGFTISFDSGKSHYDFTDKALAEYIGSYLKPKLNEILREATSA